MIHKPTAPLICWSWLRVPFGPLAFMFSRWKPNNTGGNRSMLNALSTPKTWAQKREAIWIYTGNNTWKAGLYLVMFRQHLSKITCERSESARERRIALYKSDQQNTKYSLCSWTYISNTFGQHLNFASPKSSPAIHHNTDTKTTTTMTVTSTMQ